jgi:pyruvate/2-oxoglutarate/acetoin dehydrogenase E1 component
MPTVLQQLNQALQEALETNASVYILGEDILDPYGGAFKVTRGLSTAFPDRVWTTPVSEAAIVGLATGMALRGLRPVVEIMFGDFTTLIADQLINHTAKFREMYNQQVQVPVVIRTPMGGRRGYGPTHSQSLEKLFLGVPGLRVLAPTALDDPGDLLSRAILSDDDPVLFIENKLLYGKTILRPGDGAELTFSRIPPQAGDYTPAYALSVSGAPAPRLTLATYGYMVEIAREALLRLAYEHEVFAEMVVPTRLAPIQVDPIVSSLRQTMRLLTVEEGTLSLGWGAEVVARCAEALGGELGAARRLGALEGPIPASKPLEDAALPDVDTVIRAALEMVKNHA